MRRIEAFTEQCKTCYLHGCGGVTRCTDCRAYFEQGWVNYEHATAGSCGCLDEVPVDEQSTGKCMYYKPCHKTSATIAKRLVAYWQQYKVVQGRTLYDCYNAPNTYKRDVWHKWRIIASSANSQPTVLAYNYHNFTLAFTTDKLFVVVTRTKTLTAKLSELPRLQ